MAVIRAMLLTYGKGGRPGTKLSTVKGIVIHWTANTGKGANALANRNYFENNPDKKVSAHYIVDDSQIIQCIPDSEIAYHVGAKFYKEEAIKRLGNYPNSCTIGIEMCVNSDGNFSKTYVNAVNLAAQLLKKYNLTVNNLWRHFDITGKDCPRYFVDDNTAKQFGFSSAQAGWDKFKADVNQILRGNIGVSNSSEDNNNKIIYPVVKILIGNKEFAGYNIQGTVYAPVRNIAESLGKQVIWDNVNKTVIIK